MNKNTVMIRYNIQDSLYKLEKSGKNINKWV